MSDKMKMYKLLAEVSNNENEKWEDDTDGFNYIYEDEDELTPEYYLDDNGSDVSWVNPLYVEKKFKKELVKCEFVEKQTNFGDVTITRLVDKAGNVILYNLTVD